MLHVARSALALDIGAAALVDRHPPRGPTRESHLERADPRRRPHRGVRTLHAVTVCAAALSVLLTERPASTLPGRSWRLTLSPGRCGQPQAHCKSAAPKRGGPLTLSDRRAIVLLPRGQPGRHFKVDEEARRTGRVSEGVSSRAALRRVGLTIWGYRGSGGPRCASLTAMRLLA